MYTLTQTLTATTTALFGGRIVAVVERPIPPQTKPLPHQRVRVAAPVVPYMMTTFAATPAEAEAMRRSAALCSPSRFVLTGSRL